MISLIKSGLVLIGIVVLLSNLSVVWAENISIEPKEINLIVTNEDVTSKISFSFLTSSTKNYSNIQIVPTSLVSEKTGLHINHERIDIKPKSLDLKSTDKERVVVDLNLKDISPGKYKGKLLFFNKEFENEIPINISISSSNIIPLIPIALGVGSNFFIKYVKRIAARRDMVKEAFDEAVDVYHEIKLQGKTNQYVNDGLEFLKLVEDDINKGNFDDAKRYANQAKKLFEKAKNFPNAKLTKLLQAPPDTVDIRPFIIRITRSKEMVIFSGLSLIVGATVLTVWTEFISQSGPFGISYVDYITAFLYGFASQAVLGETLDLAKR